MKRRLATLACVGLLGVLASACTKSEPTPPVKPSGPAPSASTDTEQKPETPGTSVAAGDPQTVQQPQQPQQSPIEPPVATGQDDNPTGQKPPVGTPPDGKPPEGNPPPDKPAGHAAYDIEEKTPLDPIEANGPIFVDWPKPQLAIVMSGEQDGYLEPCGCAGLENQKGGLGRRYSCIQDLRDKGWPVLALDLGNLIRRFGKQAEIKFKTSVDAYNAMQYKTVGFGPDDLRLPADFLVNHVTDQLDGSPSLFVSSNVAVFDAALGPPKFRIIEEAGMKIGITTALCDSHREEIRSDEIVTKPAAEALKEVMPEIKECDVRVLMSFGSVEEANALAKQFPDFDIVVTAGGAEMPPAQPVKIQGTQTLLVEVGHKGMYLSVLGVYDSKQTPWRFQRVPVDSRFKDATTIRLKMAAMQIEFEQLGWEGLQLRPVTHPSGHEFVGSSKCGECHTTAFEIWSHTPHAHATKTLTQLDPKRQFDPECISCHATGWEPQKYFPFKSGYVSLEATPHLRANGCENCHGPGSRHVAIEQFDIEVKDDERDKVRGEMRLTMATKDGLEQTQMSCLKCHDLDNSPEFDFDKYWPAVEHKGKD